MRPVTPARPDHLPHLDALRGLAIIGVLCNHMITTSPIFLGWFGVELFFVLSGFLITRILLASRDEAEASGAWGPALISFYLRRALRIFPVYYLCVFGLLLLQVPGMGRDLLRHLAYISNFRIMAHPYEANHVPHFWSLCVEEQFYLVWPFLILFLPRRLLVPAMAGVALLGPASRLFFALHHAQRAWLYMHPFCSLDCLAMGGLLAAVEKGTGPAGLASSSFVTWCRRGALLTMPLFLYLLNRTAPLMARAWFGELDVAWIIGNTCLALTFTWAVAAACHPGEGDWRRLLEMRWLHFTGRISYGVYVYHCIVIYFISVWVPAAALVSISQWSAVLGLPATFLVALASWYCLERPLLGLKDAFTAERVSGWFGRRAPEVPARRQAA